MTRRLLPQRVHVPVQHILGPYTASDIVAGPTYILCRHKDP